MAIDELAPGSSHERQARAAAWVGGAGSGGHGGARPQGERMTILGIDPGKSGAVAVLDEGGDLLKVLDVPSTPEANGSRQLIDGESKGKNHVISIDPESPRHRGHPAGLANKQRGNCRMEKRMICAVESEARNAVASIRIVEFLRESPEVRAAVADLQSGDSFRIAVGAAQLLVRSTGVVTADDDDDIPF